MSSAQRKLLFFLVTLGYLYTIHKETGLTPGAPIALRAVSHCQLPLTSPTFLQKNHDLQQIFSMYLALSLPPHRPYECYIELLPEAPFPSGFLFGLSRKESEVMEKYIDYLEAGII